MAYIDNGLMCVCPETSLVNIKSWAFVIMVHSSYKSDEPVIFFLNWRIYEFNKQKRSLWKDNDIHLQLTQKTLIVNARLLLNDLLSERVIYVVDPRLIWNKWT